MRDELLGRWPMAQDAVHAANTVQVIREPDILWRYEGECHRTLVGLFAATEHLTAGKIALQPGQRW